MYVHNRVGTLIIRKLQVFVKGWVLKVDWYTLTLIQITI